MLPSLGVFSGAGSFPHNFVTLASQLVPLLLHRVEVHQLGRKALLGVGELHVKVPQLLLECSFTSDSLLKGLLLMGGTFLQQVTQLAQLL
jgi:hypothetical protein